MFYRFEFKNSDGEWEGIFSALNPYQRRQLKLYEPKWYKKHLDVNSHCWFTEKGYNKFGCKIEEIIEDIRYYHPLEVRLLKEENLDNISLKGAIQCIQIIKDEVIK